MVLLVWAARVVLVAVFAVAGVAKLADLEGERKSLGDFGVPPFLRKPFAVLLPLAELACAAALVWQSLLVWGAGGLLGMLILFSAAMAVTLARGHRPDCHCFGQLHASPIGAGTLVRNAVLAAMAGLVLWQGPRNATLGALRSSLRVFQTGWPAAAAVFGFMLVLYVWTLFHLLRQNGRLLLRVEALEARIGKAEPEAAGLPIGTVAPAFSVAGLDGETATLEGLTRAGKPVVLVFGEPGCGPCEMMFPDLARWQQLYAVHLTVALVSRGQPEANRDCRDKNGLRNVLLQKDREISIAYRSGGTPSAVVIKEGKISTPIAEGAEAILSMIVRATLPPPVKKGDAVPSLRFPDLEGNTLDLSTLRGRHTLLVFWSPDCGFCQSMLTDLQTEERIRLKGAPEVLIIAKGSAEANRAQGFRSRLLLDPHFAAATVFGASGTPSAVLIGEDGRVASEVGMGACGSFELLGFLPYVPTPDATVERMLTLAKVQRTDTLYDLGCGDGRVVVAAAKMYGAHGVGVDVNPERLAEARASARKASVEELVRFEERNLFDTDIRPATVVTFYLLPKINLQLRSKLLSDLRPGTRVVSHAFDMQDWKPDGEDVVDGNHIYLWTIPARR